MSATAAARLAERPNVTRIAHLSDIHVLDLTSARPWSFAGKRATGGLNLLLRRSKAHQREPIVRALEELTDAGVDHVVVTGDLTNLALESEFNAARQILEEYGDGRRLSVIPGNHDYYTHGSVRRKAFEGYFTPWMESELPEQRRQGPYPFVKFIGPVALVGLCSCIASPPLFAVGRVGKAQLTVLPDILDHAEVRRRFSIVAFHHHVIEPPHVKRRSEWMRRMLDGDELLHLLKRHRANLGIHGHTHQFAFHSLPHADGSGTLHISEVGSTSLVQYKDELHASKYNVYEIEDGDPPRLARVVTKIWDAASASFVPWKELTLPAPAS